MRRIARAWVELLGRKEPGTTFATFRIAVALVILYSLLSIGLHGLVEVLWVDEAYGGYRPLPGNWVHKLFGGVTPGVVWTLYTCSLLGAVAMAVGIGGRIPIVVLVVGYGPMAMVNSGAYGGYDMMISNALWLLLLGNATATLSLDCRRHTGQWTSDELVSAWPRYLVIFQLIVIYTCTGLHKLSADWVPGGTHAALYWVFQDPTWTRFDLRDLSARLYPLTQVGTAMTWFWEVSAPLLLLVYYFRDTADRGGRIRRAFNRYDLRKPWAAIGVALHLGILVVLNVGPFSFISLAYYVCIFRR
jgi:hypothetical protein